MMWFLCPLAHAGEVAICYNYGCSTTASVIFMSHEIESVALLFNGADDPASERERIARALALLHSFTARQTPTRFDRPGNYEDDLVDGRMDCIDHSRNTTAYLDFLKSLGLIKHHRVMMPVMRAPWLVDVHWAARIADQEGNEFAVDSWLSEIGVPVPVMTLDAWRWGRNG